MAWLSVMSLQPPRDESLNGLLQGYRIYYRELEAEAGADPEAKTLKSLSALRAELTGEQTSLPGPGPAMGTCRGHSSALGTGAGRAEPECHRPREEQVPGLRGHTAGETGDWSPRADSTCAQWRLLPLG
jgi:hypothetical protein